MSKNLKIKKIVLMIGVAAFFGMIIVASARAIPLNAYTLNDRDSYVSESSPNSNYGNFNDVKMGADQDGLYEAYIHFTLSSKPDNIIKAEFGFQVTALSETVEVNISSADNAWTETGINWANSRALKGNTLATEQITKIGIYLIDLTSLISGATELSFCVSIANASSVGLATATAREVSTGYALWGASILWTYDGILVVDGYSIAITITIVGSVGLVLVIMMRKRMKVTKK